MPSRNVRLRRLAVHHERRERLLRLPALIVGIGMAAPNALLAADDEERSCFAAGCRAR
jgi:hypothetical protein